MLVLSKPIPNGASTASGITYTSIGTSVPRTQKNFNDNYANIFDWLTSAEQTDVRAGTGLNSYSAKINLALTELGAGRSLLFPSGVYKTTETIRNFYNGENLIGEGSYGFTFGGVLGDGGTRFSYAGAGGGTVVNCTAIGAADLLVGVSMSNIQIDGGGLARYCMLHQAAWNCTVERVTMSGLNGATNAIALSTGSKTGGTNAMNYNYRNVYRSINLVAAGSAKGFSMKGGAYCAHYDMHSTHKNGTAIELLACDDNHFFNTATSRELSGTGKGLHLHDVGYAPCVQNIFYGLSVAASEPYYSLPYVMKITAEGSMSKCNKIYGLAGIDTTPTIELLGGAELFYDYDGSHPLNGGDARTRCAPLNISGGHLLEAVSADAMMSTAAVGAYVKKIRVKIDGTYYWIPVYA